MSKPIFEEEQPFRQWWIWLGLLITLGLVGYQLFLSQNFGSWTVFIPVLIILLIGVLLWSSKLCSRIDENGIHLKFFPLHLSFRTYPWESLYSVEVKKYSPILDYGGWGYRLSFSGKGKAFNVKGNQGIYLITADGKKRMIGTQKPEEARSIVKQYFKPKKESKS